MQKTAFIVEHDFVMASALSDRVIVYSGEPGIECTANSPQQIQEGFNDFLKQLNVTLRRDPANFRKHAGAQNNQPGPRLLRCASLSLRLLRRLRR